MRKIDLVSTPFWHRNFYLRNIRKVLNGNERLRVLICGAADHAMLSVAHHALQENAIFYMIDLCPTPLTLSQLYALQNNLTFIGKMMDARRLEFPNEYFDIIVTDAFLTRFDRNDQKRIISEWYRVLKKNGVVITTVRIGKGRFKAGLKERIKYSLRAFLKSKSLKCLIKAWKYSKEIRSNPLSLKDIRNLFSRFKIKIKVKDGFTEIRNKKYARIIASKDKFFF